MKYMLVGNKNNKFGFKSKLLLGTLALAVVAGLGAAVQAAQEDKDNATDPLLYRQMGLFDPFTLISSSTMDIMPESSESLVIIIDGGKLKRPPIRIPFRPVPRSPFQPP